MDHRVPLKVHTVLAFEGMACHIEEVIGQGSNAIDYKGWYQDNLNSELHHHVLVKELFPFHPQKGIFRAESGHLVIESQAEELWETHKQSFLVGNKMNENGNGSLMRILPMAVRSGVRNALDWYAGHQRFSEYVSYWENIASVGRRAEDTIYSGGYAGLHCVRIGRILWTRLK